MIRRTSTTAALIVMLMGIAPVAWAQHAEEPPEGENIEPEPGEVATEAAEQAVPTTQIGLPPEAINWTNFDYQSEAAEEHYAQYGVHAPGAPVVAMVFNFALLLLLLYLIARKPLSAYLQARSDGVREGLVEAKKMLEEANERLAEYSARLERMDDEMSKLREEFIAAGEAERDRLVAEAGARAEKMRRDAKTRLEQELAQLREELRVSMVEKAVEASTALLEKEVKEADRRRLADEYLEQIEREGVGR